MGLWAAALLMAMSPLHGATVPATADALDMDAHRAALAASAKPVLSQVDAWVGAMVIVILAMFATAAVIGPVATANMPQEIPAAAGHDDSHGDAHDHSHRHH
jgi:hypothetical protein